MSSCFFTLPAMCVYLYVYIPYIFLPITNLLQPIIQILSFTILYLPLPFAPPMKLNPAATKGYGEPKAPAEQVRHRQQVHPGDQCTRYVGHSLLKSIYIDR